MNLHNPSNPSLVYRKKSIWPWQGTNQPHTLLRELESTMSTTGWGRGWPPSPLVRTPAALPLPGSGRRGDGGVGAASRAAGRRRWERRGEGDRGRGRGRERGSIRSRGGTILMAHHPSVRHKYIHANGAPHPGAPLVFFFTSARANRLSTTWPDTHQVFSTSSTGQQLVLTPGGPGFDSQAPQFFLCI